MKPGDPIDPTANVLALVQAAVKRLDDLREADIRRVNEVETIRFLHIDSQLKNLHERIDRQDNLFPERLAELERSRYTGEGKSGLTMVLLIMTSGLVGSIVTILIQRLF